MAKVIAKTYGDALFDLAMEQGRLAETEAEISLLSQSFAENPELFAFLNHPKITKEEKIRVMEQILRDRVDDTVTGFLVLIVEKGRYNEIAAIFDYFHARVREYNKVGVAKIVSAAELNEEQKQRIESKLLEQTSYESFETDYQVDKTLIGGMVIRIGDRVVDSSIRTKLETMSKVLKSR